MWKEIFIKNKSEQNLYCRYFESNPKNPNIIYLQTPVISVSGISEKIYEPLANFGYNIYAIDFTGIGKSEGNINTFSVEQIISDINSIIDYIEKNSEREIFLYASTGIGGICGQYFVSRENRIKAFAQYGVGIFEDLSIMKMPLWAGKTLFKIVKIVSKVFPNLKVKMNPPKYNGKNKKLDDDIYKELLKENPKLFFANIKWIETLMQMFLDKESSLKNPPKCPSLVFKTLHDRYFKESYIDKYYESLKCEKKMYVIDDIHNSYYLYAQEICKEVSEWFLLHT